MFGLLGGVYNNRTLTTNSNLDAVTFSISTLGHSSEWSSKMELKTLKT